MTSELRKAGLLPTVDAPAVDIEAFVERHLKVRVDQHAELQPSVLGKTEFERGKPPRISMNKDLTEEATEEEHSPAWMLGRWRATWAHEGSHVILHRCLYEIDPMQGDLFSFEEGTEEHAQQLPRCLKRDVSFTHTGGDWREVQANMGMAALLMPRPLYAAICKREQERAGIRARKIEKGSVEANRLAARLATLFQVSQQAATIRLETVGVLCTEGMKVLL